MPAASKTLGGKQMSETYRECRLQIVYKHQFGTQLYACAVIHLMFSTGIPGRQTCTEERALYPCGKAEQGTEIVHSNGAQVQFGSGLGIRVCLYGVDVGSRHGQCCTVLEGIAVINMVIAESAQIGIAEHRLGIAEVMPGSRTQPEGCVTVERQQRTEIASALNGWIECAANQIAIAVDAELVALLVHHSAKRPAQLRHFAVECSCLHRFHVAHRTFDTMVCKDKGYVYSVCK